MIVHLIHQDIDTPPYWLSSVAPHDAIVLMRPPAKALELLLIDKKVYLLGKDRLTICEPTSSIEYIEMAEFVTICAQADKVISW